MGTQSTTADVLWGQLSTREKILLLILNTGTLACGLTIERAFLLFLVSIGVQYCGCLAVLFLISHKVEPMQLMGSGCAIALIVPVGCALMKFAGFHFDVALVVGLNCCLASFGAILSILPAQIIRLDGKKEEQDTPSPPSVPDATPSTPVPQVNNLNAVKERELTIRLLYSMVPPKIASDLANGREVLPQMYDFAVIFFSDIQGFTAFAAINSSLEVFAMLERVFTVMDYCVGLFPSLYKVETAGDSYMVVGGLDGFDDDNVEDEEDAGNLGLAEGGGVGASESAMHSTERQSRLSALKSSPSFQSLVHASQGNARDTKNVIVANAVCQFALLVRDAVQKVNMDESSFVQIRIGIHCGSITTGISGKLTPKFCIFGDTVNCAARMEQTGRTGKVHISAGMRSFILHSSLSREYYDYEKREPIEVKGKGTLQTYFLECTKLDKFRTKYAKEIECIDTLVITNHLGKFAQQGGKVILSASVSGASLSTSVDSDTASTAQRRFGLWKDIISSDLEKVDEQKQAKEALGAWAPPSRADESRELAEGIARECRFMPKRYSSDGSNSTRGDQEGIFNTPTYAQMMADDFSVLSVEQDDFSAIQAAIFELICGVVGGDVEDVNVDEVVLQRFIRRIGTMYREVPYHNFWHAFCVCRECAFIIKATGIDRIDPLCEDVKRGFTRKELFTVMLSALVHDVDHPGTNNDFEVKTSSRLALLYNDNSCLENHHLALTFNILHMPQYNVFELWWDEEKKDARRIMTHAVLNTDMAQHSSLQLDLQARSIASRAYDLTRFDERMELVKIILHAADIFNVARAPQVSFQISLQVAEEFRQQTLKESSLGLPPTPWMVLPSPYDIYKGELHFCKNVARPYFAALRTCFPGNPDLNFLPRIDSNVQNWSAEVRRLEKQELKKHEDKVY